jgi:serine protease Do
VVVREDGYVVTNAHVEDGSGDIEVVLESGEALPATLVGRDRSVDIAVLRVRSDTPLVAAALGDSAALQVGEWVVAVGAPFRLNGTVSTGIVSALDRRVRSLSLTSAFIQTDAAINPGNSGGPLANLQGEVIGINAAIAVSEEAQRSQRGAYQGVGFAIPINTVRRVASRLIGRAGLMPAAEPAIEPTA